MNETQDHTIDDQVDLGDDIESPDVHDFEEMRALGTRTKPSRRTTEVLSSIGDGELMRSSIEAVRAIGDLYGDEEAHLADRARDVEANLMVLQLVLAHHPDRLIASILPSLDDPKRAEVIKRLQAVLDEYTTGESATVVATVGEPEPAEVVPMMWTGSRTLGDVGATREAFRKVTREQLERHPGLVVISGGAQGVDQLAAWAAHDEEVPFTLFLPNWAYEYHYGQHEALEELRASPFFTGERVCVERPRVAEWKTLWSSQRWWQDNFSRNDRMIKAAAVHCAGSWHTVADVLADANIKGGTAHALRRMGPLGVKTVEFVDLADPTNAISVTL